MKFVIKVHCNDNFPNFEKGVMQRVTVFKYWFLLLFICRDESPQEDEDEPPQSEKKKKKKKKGSRATNKKAMENKMMVSVDTSTKAKGGKHQGILGVQQGSQKLTVKMLFNKSSSSSDQLEQLDTEEAEQPKSKK